MMDPVSQFQNVFRVNKVGPEGTAKGIVRRNRKPVSCVPCRTRKLKCDRQEPCKTCVLRDVANSCTYSAGSTGNAAFRSSNKTVEAQTRLRKLEVLVADLIQTKNTGHAPEGDSSYQTKTIEKRLGGLTVEKSQFTYDKSSVVRKDDSVLYYGSTHWSTILENIRDIQGMLGSDQDAQPNAAYNRDDIGDKSLVNVDPVLDQSIKLTPGNIIEFLPERKMVDKLLSMALNTKHLHMPFIHSVQFMREYELFWKNVASTSLLWISMLLCLLFLGARIDQIGLQLTSSSVPSPAAILEKAGQSLVAGEYRKCKTYSVESVLLYAICRHFVREDMDIYPWTLMGVTARIAMRMGYHRDPKYLNYLTPFQAEMRRRAFIVIENFDMLLSAQAGLPPILQEEDCDVEIPLNLFDHDFDENCQTLPQSRPETELTPLLYYVTKNRFCKTYRRVTRHAISPNVPTYNATMALDLEVRTVRGKAPSCLQYRPIASSFAEQSFVIMYRLNLEVIYQKSICVLHRNYLNRDRLNPDFEYSRRACVDAALRLLDIQQELWNACMPGATLSHDTILQGSLTMHDFLLAAMVVSFDIHERHRSVTRSQDESESRRSKFDLLQKAHDIWQSKVEHSEEARRAAGILGSTLLKIQGPNIDVSPASSSSVSQTSTWGSNATACSSADTNLSLQSGLGHALPENTTSYFELPDIPYSNFPENMFSSLLTTDWSLFDQSLVDLEMPSGDSSYDWLSFGGLADQAGWT